MINKLKKYIKFVLSISLILGLVGLSYAAISSSDGSSFVSKTEFDNALADFNKRLTTFEASTNSRIDSQVVSYLEKYGIWSKEDIIFKTGSSSYSIKSGIESKIAYFDTDGKYLLTETDWDWAKMNKSGLSSWAVKQTESGYRELHNASNINATANTYTWYLSFDVYDKNGNLLRTASNIVVRSGTPTYEYSAASNNYVQLFIGYSPAVYPVYFFVNKNEFVKFSEHWDTVGCYNWDGSRSPSWEKGNVPNYSFSDCGIY